MPEAAVPEHRAVTEPNAPVEAAIRRAIAERGPISFAEFMDLALYGPGGFYDRPPVGEGGHFVTSPHVHPVFGALMGRALRALWQAIDRPTPFRIVEVGAGDGTLAKQLRRALAEIPKDYVAVERSAGGRRALRALDPPMRVLAGLEAMDQHLHGCIVANELLDNLPFRWARRDHSGEVFERLVHVWDGRFELVDGPFDGTDDEIRGGLPDLAPGMEGPIPEGSLHLVDRLARLLRHGYALLVDYAAGPDADIHGYRDQRVVEDVLEAPGTADITAGVDFAVLGARARALGLQSFSPVTQRSALLALGYAEWQTEEHRRQADAQDRRSGREAVMAWSGRNAAAMLTDPAGLGRLRWWLVSSDGLEAPQWFRKAARLDVEGTLVAGETADGTIGYVDIPHRRWARRRRC